MTDEIASAPGGCWPDLGEALARRRDDLVESQGEDIGAPCTIAGLEVDLAVDHLKTMAAEVPQVQGKRPYGTVAAIFPYDAPPIMLARVGGAAVLGGNRFRYSCSSQTPAFRPDSAGSGGPLPGNRGGDRPRQPGVRAVVRPGPRRQGPVHLRRRRRWERPMPGRPSTSISSFSPGPAACRPSSCSKMRLWRRRPASWCAGPSSTAASTAPP